MHFGSVRRGERNDGGGGAALRRQLEEVKRGLEGVSLNTRRRDERAAATSAKPSALRKHARHPNLQLMRLASCHQWRTRGSGGMLPPRGVTAARRRSFIQGEDGGTTEDFGL